MAKGVRMENFDKLKEILIDILGAKEEDVKAESKFVDKIQFFWQ